MTITALFNSIQNGAHDLYQKMIGNDVQSLLDATQKEAQELYFKMSGKEEKIETKLYESTLVAQSLANEKTLRIHPLFLINPDQLPKNLRSKSEKVSDDDVLQIKNWLSREFKIDKTKLTSLKGHLKIFRKLWNMPNLYIRIKRFILAHEMAHIHHKHLTFHFERLVTMIVSVAASFFLAHHLSFLPLMATVFLVGFISQILFTNFREYSERHQEIQADQTAVKITKDKLAAKALFEIIKEEKIWSWDHPSPQTRIDALELLA